MQTAQSLSSTCTLRIESLFNTNNHLNRIISDHSYAIHTFRQLNEHVHHESCARLSSCSSVRFLSSTLSAPASSLCSAHFCLNPVADRPLLVDHVRVRCPCDLSGKSAISPVGNKSFAKTPAHLNSHFGGLATFTGAGRHFHFVLVVV